MDVLVQSLLEQAAQMSALETLAVVLAVAYLLLAIRQNIWCWAAAAVSTGIYIYLFHSVALLMESLLNVFYLVMAGYGWQQWRYGGRDHTALPVSSWPFGIHATAWLIIALASFASGRWLATHTEAAWPYLDSLTTWSAVWATFLTARKVLENWWYWLLIDAISVFLFFDRGLPLTAALYVVYLALIPIGFVAWRATLNKDDAVSVAV